MSTNLSEPADPGNPRPFDSGDSVILIIDGPGDTTVRPLPPRLRELAMAERDKLIKYQQMLEKPPTTDRPPNTEGSESADHCNSAGFDSVDSMILIIDGPGDTTVRPLPPRLRELAMAERDKLIKYQQMLEQPPVPDKPADSRGAKPEDS